VLDVREDDLDRVSRAFSPRAGLALAGLVVIVAAGTLHFLGESRVKAAGLEPEEASVIASKPPGTAPELPDESTRQSGAEVLGESPAAAFLTAYFGPDASAVRAQLEANGSDLDGMLPPVSPENLKAMLPTWLVFKDAERESWRRELESWPTNLTSAWLQQRMGLIIDLNEDDLEALDALATLYRPDIQAAADRYLDSVETAMFEEFQWGGIKTSPFLAWPPQAPGGPAAFFSMVRAGQGWVAQITLTKEDHPDAYAARGAIALEIHKRDVDLQQTLLALQ